MRAFIFILLASLFTQIGVAQAQNAYDPVIQVNQKVITRFELDQRQRMLQLFNTPGDLAALAREQLIDDRLKQQEIERAGLRMTDEALQSELEAFAGRANLSLPQFLSILNSAGVQRETFVDFVRTGASWRNYVSQRYRNQANVTDREVNQRLSQGGSAPQVEVLLSEIIIPAPPPRAAQAMATAQQISQLRSTSAFSAQAARVSAVPSRNNGGRLDWMPIGNLPPAIGNLILDLSPGEVTPPLQIPGAIALFQLRDLREGAYQRPTGGVVDYATLYVADANEARNVAARVDTCDDLYGIARGRPADQLQRQTSPVSGIPADYAIELARLDPGESSYNVTRSNGQVTVFLMLCNRDYSGGEADRDAVADGIRSQKFSGYGDALLGQLRANATIINR